MFLHQIRKKCLPVLYDILDRIHSNIVIQLMITTNNKYSICFYTKTEKKCLPVLYDIWIEPIVTLLSNVG